MGDGTMGAGRIRCTLLLGIALGVLTLGAMMVHPSGASAQDVFIHSTVAGYYDEFGQLVPPEYLLQRGTTSGTPAEQVATTPAGSDYGLVSNMSVSADGQSIAYVGNYGTTIYIMDRDGRSVRPVITLGSLDRIEEPRFSPDGNWIYFDYYSSSNGYRSDILRATTDGSFAQWFITGAGDQFGISFSADGDRIAYESGELTSPDPPLPYQIIVADSDGSDPQTLDTSGVEHGAMLFGATLSPDGTEVAFSSAPLQWDGSWRTDHSTASDLYTIDVTDGALSRVALTPARDESRPIWANNGDRLVYSDAPQWASDDTDDPDFTYLPWGNQLVSAHPDGSDPEVIYPGASNAVAEDWQTPIPRDSSLIDPHQLLQQYAPEMAYNEGEQYFADSAAELTDAPRNTLVQASDGAVLAAHGQDPIPELSLDELGALGTGLPSEDYMAATNFDPTPADEAADLHAQPQYANHIYGRVMTDDSGHTWLQYFFFYYFNDEDVLGFGLHQGDWETMQIRLGADGVPDRVVFGEHTGFRSCDWSELDHEIGPWGTIAPVVYVALGGHASYPLAGSYALGGPNDNAHGDGARAWPALQDISDPGPAWLDWGGYWGATDYTESHSPVGPRFQTERWSHPDQMWLDGRACDADLERDAPAFGAQLAGSPAPPQVTSRWNGHAARIRWHRSAAPSGRLVLVLRRGSSKSAGHAVVMHAASGTTLLTPPSGHGKLTISALAVTRNGRQSEVVRARIQPNGSRTTARIARRAQTRAASSQQSLGGMPAGLLGQPVATRRRMIVRTADRVRNERRTPNLRLAPRPK